MCAIKPAHKKRFIFDVYTSDNELSEHHFQFQTRKAMMDVEIKLNTHTKFRWHCKETEDEAE